MTLKLFPATFFLWGAIRPPSPSLATKRSVQARTEHKRSEMQCEGDDEPDSYVVPGEQHPGYFTQNFDSLSYLQGIPTEESTMVELEIYPTASCFSAAGQDLVARTGAALPYAPSWESSYTSPPPYGLIPAPDSGYVGLEAQIPLPPSDLNPPPESFTSVFVPDHAGGYSYGYNTPQYQHQSYEYPQDGSSATQGPANSLRHSGANVFAYHNNTSPSHTNLLQYQHQGYEHPQGSSSATQDPAHSLPHPGAGQTYEHLQGGSRATQYPACSLPHPGAGVLPCRGGARIPLESMSSHLQSNTDAGMDSMVACDTGPSGDVIPSLLHIRDGETAGPSAGSPPSKSSNPKPGDPNKKKQATRKNERSKAKGNKNNRPQLLDPQPGPIQVTAQSLLGRPGLQVLRQIAYESGNEQKNRPQFVDINFSVGGKEGIRLPDAMDRIFDGPDGRDELMFTNENIGSSISCRIIFEGYGAWAKAKQIATMDYRDERSPITKKKLANDVARRIQTYLKDLEDAGDRYPIPFEDMVLVRLKNVAQASWQPEIWYSGSASA